MAKTRDQIIIRALRKLGVAAEDDDPAEATLANSSEALDSVLAEVRASAFRASWTTSFPDEVANALSDLLAAELAPEYPLVDPPYPRSRAFARLMELVRPDDRFALPYTGQWGVEEISTGVYGYERSGVTGSLLPVMPNLRQVSATTAGNVFRIVTDGREKIRELDRIEIRLSSYQAAETILTWNDTFRDYRVVDEALTTLVVGLEGLTTQLTVMDPEQASLDRAAYY